MPRRLAALVLFIVLASCGQKTAPEEAGVCWLAHGAGDTFTPLARNIDSLETCAVLLEARRLQGQAETNGAYQGYFIFVDDRQIASALHQRGFRYPILHPPQRVSVDRDLRSILKSRGGKLPEPGDLAIERR